MLLYLRILLYLQVRCDDPAVVGSAASAHEREVAQVIAHDAISHNVSALPMLMAGVTVSCSANLVHVRFSQPHRALSCAVLNGGFCHASDFLNLRVASHSPDVTEDPAASLQRLSDQLQCRGPAVGMMTAASLASLRVISEDIGGETLAVLVTTGLENARSAGDLAEHRSLDDVPGERGTINLAIVTSAQIADAALVEMVAIATEAKTAVLHELEITSPVSGRLATGTGTDAIAVFSGHGVGRARFAGKHTLLGERLAVLVMHAIRSSVNYSSEDYSPEIYSSENFSAQSCSPENTTSVDDKQVPFL
jgi:adenosylcobinamide amidohydrolase